MTAPNLCRIDARFLSVSVLEETPALRRPEDVRAENNRVAAEAERLRFTSRIPFLCECTDANCREIILVDAETYEEIRSDPRNFITAPKHQLGFVADRAGRDFWVQRWSDSAPPTLR